MPRYHTSIRSSWKPDAAFAYMSDFSNAAEWDPGVVRAAAAPRESESGAPAYDLVVSTAGREMPLRYRVVRRSGRRITFQALTPRLLSEDTITVRPARDGSVVEYDAVLSLRGPAKLLNPFLGVVFRRIGDRARTGLASRLGEVTP